MRGAFVLPEPPAAPADSFGPAVAWLAAAVATLVLDAPPTVAAPAAAALTLLAFHHRVGVGLLAAVAAALGACAEAGPAALLAGAALALVAGLVGRPAARGAATERPDEIERHLARCRRSGAPADFVVASCPGPEAARAVAADLRLSDSVRVRGAEVHAMLDRAGLDRAGFAARAAARPGVVLGWARYPEDALTAGDLEVTARPAPDARPAPAADGAPVHPSPAAAAATAIASAPAAGIAALATAVAEVAGAPGDPGPAAQPVGAAAGGGPATGGVAAPAAPAGAAGVPGD